MNDAAVESPLVVSPSVISPFIVTVAPDSFKGSCTSSEAASAIAEGVRSVFGSRAEVRELPMADGGEGTLEALAASWNGRIENVAVTDALGRARSGRVGFSGLDSGSPRSAIIEAADANGLPAIADVPLRPLDADSAGVGALVLAALDSGVDEILLCLGGSATSDGGVGMMRALGARFLGSDGSDVAPGARGLSQLHTIDLTSLDPRAHAVKWRIACDVDNPLAGPLGAAAVFGPQKGATPSDVKLIDAGLTRLGRALTESATRTPTVTATTTAIEQTPGLGAAGGLGLGPVALFGAELVPGAQLVGEAIGLEVAIADADLVITGEGRLDSQSLNGKVVSRVLTHARDSVGSPSVIVLAGSVGLSTVETQRAGIAAAFSIANGPANLAELERDVRSLLIQAAAHASSTYLAGTDRPRRPRS